MSKSNSTSTDFRRLNATLSIRQPNATLTGGSANAASPVHASPRLILLFTWLGASPRAVNKYTTGLESLYPDATIYLVGTAFNTYATATASWQRTQLSPLVSELQVTDTKAILILSLSNSGAQKLAFLATEYRACTGKPFSPQLVILDSAPGRMSLQSGMNAMSQALPRNWLLHHLGRLMLYTVGVATIGFYTLSGLQDGQEWVRRVLNGTTDGQEAPALSGDVGARVYIFAEEDNIVPAADVRSHAVEAEAKGWRVELEKFDASQHCTHLKTDEERYWNVVRRGWARSAL